MKMIFPLPRWDMLVSKRVSSWLCLTLFGAIVLFTNPQRKPRKKRHRSQRLMPVSWINMALQRPAKFRVGKLQVEDFGVRFGVSNCESIGNFWWQNAAEFLGVFNPIRKRGRYLTMFFFPRMILHIGQQTCILGFCLFGDSLRIRHHGKHHHEQKPPLVGFLKQNSLVSIHPKNPQISLRNGRVCLNLYETVAGCGHLGSSKWRLRPEIGFLGHLHSLISQ